VRGNACCAEWAPPSDVARMASSPTAHPWLASGKETARSVCVVPAFCCSQWPTGTCAGGTGIMRSPPYGLVVVGLPAWWPGAVVLVGLSPGLPPADGEPDPSPPNGVTTPLPPSGAVVVTPPATLSVFL